MNGKHEVRLERIEARIDELHDKVDEVVERGVANKADIVWLKWTMRLIVGAVLGLGGMTLPSLL